MTDTTFTRALARNSAKPNFLVLWDEAAGLANLSSYTRTRSGQGAGPASTFSISGDVPGAGAGFWYLFRDTGTLGQGATGYCNAPGITWGSAERDAALP